MPTLLSLLTVHAWLLFGPQVPARAPIQFLEESGVEMADWSRANASLTEAACALSLSVQDPLAIDSTLFLFGELREAAGAYRSLLLRSEDAGRSWREVMPPVPASAVLGLSFPSAAHGAALVGWVVEGPGELGLWATENRGLDWKKISGVPKPHMLDSASRFVCTDAGHCLVSLDCPVGAEGATHVLESLDGGRSWRGAKGGLPQPVEPGHDGRARWRVVERRAASDVLVQRQATPGGPWVTAATLPLRMTRTAGGGVWPCAGPSAPAFPPDIY